MRNRNYRHVELPRPPSQAVMPQPGGGIVLTLANGSSELIRLYMTRETGWRLVTCLVETLRDPNYGDQ
jgi:hypothetical protein